MEPANQITTIQLQVPKLALLVNDFQECVSASAGLVTQQATDYRTRFALWNGQHGNGRKGDKDAAGEEPMPWKHASDVRIFEADATINEQVRMMMAAWERG